MTRRGHKDDSLYLIVSEFDTLLVLHNRTLDDPNNPNMWVGEILRDLDKDFNRPKSFKLPTLQSVLSRIRERTLVNQYWEDPKVIIGDIEDGKGNRALRKYYEINELGRFALGNYIYQGHESPASLESRLTPGYLALLPDLIDVARIQSSSKTEQ